MQSWMVPMDKRMVNKSGGVPMSMFTNPMDNMVTWGQFQEPHRQGNLSFSLLKRMSMNSIISLIVSTRVNQVAAFSNPAYLAKLSGSGALGFDILHKETHKNDFNKAEKARSKEITDMVLKCGNTDRYNEKSGDIRPNFDSFLRQVTADSLIYDQGNFEKVRARNKEIIEWWPVDASTIRIAKKKKDGTYDPNQRYVQVIDGIPVVAYKYEEMAFFIRNPRTNLEAKGYGFSELERLIRTVTSHLNAEKYNSNLFMKGTTAGGILVVKGDVNEEILNTFRQEWKNMVNGVNNAGTTPVLQADGGAEYVNMKQTNRDAEYSRWMEYLITIACGMYQIDPDEIGFNFKGGLAGNAPMFETSQEAKLKHSKDKGLRPLLTSVARMINEEIVEQIDPDYFFMFTGIDSKTDKEMIEERIQELNYKTLDEVREELGLEALEKIDTTMPGSAICNSTYIQYLQMLAQQQQAAQQAQQQANNEGLMGDENWPEEGGNPEESEGNEEEEVSLFR